jgi:PAS domain S-box-containing protein
VEGQLAWSRASFLGSLVPMVIADDRRRYVAANPAACLLFRLAEADVLRMRIDDLTPPENRSNLDALWEAFLRDGVQEGNFALMMPDGAMVEVEYSATANVEPGLHLSILMFPPGGVVRHPETSEADHTPLTEREREVLGVVAEGRGTAWIAAELGVSSSTVETHIRNLLEKLGARNRAHAISLGLQRGEISLDLGSVHPRYWG